MATQRAALPILTAVYDDVGLRKLDARIARPAPQGHVRDAAVLFLDDGRGDKILVIGKSRKKVEILHVSVLIEGCARDGSRRLSLSAGVAGVAGVRLYGARRQLLLQPAASRSPRVGGQLSRSTSEGFLPRACSRS